MKTQRVDYLFLLVGTNPLPNLISAFTRVKPGGTIYLCHTKETETIAKNISELIIEKQKDNSFGISVTKLQIVKDIISKVITQIKTQLHLLGELKRDDVVIELNYTGGTKAMSAGSYYAIRDFIKDETEKSLFKFILSYLDGEKEEMVFEILYGNESKVYTEKPVKQDLLLPITLEDIISVHSINISSQFGRFPFDPDLGQRIFDLFVGCSEEQYAKAIKYLEYLFHEKFKNKKASKSSKTDKNWQELNKIDKEKIKDYDVFPEVNSLENFFKPSLMEEKHKYLGRLGGKWLEDIIFKILLDLKDQGVVEDAISSVEKESSGFEVDLLVYRDFKLFGISTTCIEKPQEAKDKLFEIKERARQLGGSEAGICFITLCWKSEDLEKEVRNAWDNEINKNILVIGVDKFPDLKNILKNWIRG